MRKLDDDWVVIAEKGQRAGRVDHNFHVFAYNPTTNANMPGRIIRASSESMAKKLYELRLNDPVDEILNPPDEQQ